MDVTFRRVTLADADSLATFLTGEVWPYHAYPRIDEDSVRRRSAAGHYDNVTARTFLIEVAGSVTGMLRVFDLDDGTPLFDLRIGVANCGRGIGTRAVRWLTDLIFTEFPHIDRIEATTRQDNHPMRAACPSSSTRGRPHPTPELIPFYDAVNTITGAHDASGYETVADIVVIA